MPACTGEQSGARGVAAGGKLDATRGRGTHVGDVQQIASIAARHGEHRVAQEREPLGVELGSWRERELRAGAAGVPEEREAGLDKAVEYDDAARRLRRAVIDAIVATGRERCE